MSYLIDLRSSHTFHDVAGRELSITYQIIIVGPVAYKLIKERKESKIMVICGLILLGRKLGRRAS